MSERKLSAVFRRILGGVSLGVDLMTPSEKRRAVLLIGTSMVNAVLQILVLVGLVWVIRFTVGDSVAPPAWLKTAMPGVDSPSLGLALGIALAILVGIKVGLSWLHVAWMARFTASCEVRLSSFLMHRTLLAPYDWLVRQNPERLRQLIFGFVSNWAREFVRSAMKILNDVIIAVFIIALLIWSQPVAGLLIAGFATALGSVIFLIVRPRIRRLAEQKRKGILGASTISTEAIHGVKDVKMASAESQFADLFDAQVALYSTGDADAQSWAQLPRHVLELVAYGALVGAALYVSLFNERSASMADVMLLYALAAMRLMPIFSTLVGGLAGLTGSLPIIHDLRRLIEQTATAESSSACKNVDWPWHKVRFDDVSMAYQKGRHALSGVTLEIERGKSYGIVGPSGAGKSTLIDILAGLLPPTLGVVSIDGASLGDHNRRNWRHRFGYVSQRPFLLDASLKQNVTFRATDDADEERLRRAVQFACLDGVVARLKGGVGGSVGPQGAFLSGGERQRVVIARALYRGADVLILDEATSSLDVIVEREIAESIAALKGHVTTFIVSHRIGLVRQCDEIWLFEDGHLLDAASHETLLKRSPLYHRLVGHVAALQAV
jgi:ABC-type multidrug transport system fused ATPase/permease subunit